MLLNRTPRYGNDDDHADELMRRIFEAYYAAIDGPPQHQGRPLPHQPAADHLPRVLRLGHAGPRPMAARPGTPLSEGISPVQGADRHGPTAVLRSAAKMDHVRTGGTLLNQKFTPSC